MGGASFPPIRLVQLDWKTIQFLIQHPLAFDIIRDQNDFVLVHIDCCDATVCAQRDEIASAR